MGEDKEPEVVSEINTFLVTSKDVKPRLADNNLVAELRVSLPLFCDTVVLKEDGQSDSPANLDEDGDLVLVRKSDLTRQDVTMYVEFQNSTTLEAVGLQIWRGAFLLGDFIIENERLFKKKTVIELGAGTGLTSIVAAMFAERVVATDLNEKSILDLIKCNMDHNSKLIRSPVGVLPLDFMDLEWPTELVDAIGQADIIMAADVIYYDKTTEAFVKTLKKILGTGTKTKEAYIAMEKRYVFTVTDLDTVAPMYAHFVDLLDTHFNLQVPKKGVESSPVLLLDSKNPNAKYVSLMEMSLDFPQHFNYEKCKELVLWRIRTSPDL